MLGIASSCFDCSFDCISEGSLGDGSMWVHLPSSLCVCVRTCEILEVPEGNAATQNQGVEWEGGGWWWWWDERGALLPCKARRGTAMRRLMGVRALLIFNISMSNGQGAGNGPN